MKRADKQRLLDKLAAIMAESSLTQDEVIAQMSDVIRKAYNVGLQTGLPLVAIDPLVTADSIQTAIDSMAARVGYIWSQMDDQLIDTIKGGIKSGLPYEDVVSSVDDLIRSGWGDTVTFDNTGNIIKRVNISPDGSMHWEDHEISRGVTLNTETYATTLSQTVVHESWNKARDDQYDRLGISSWVYSAVGDGATRPRHLALHGTVIARGSPEEAMANDVMSEDRCRCVKIPYWNDPEYDTPPETFERQKIAAAKQIRNNIPDDSKDAAFLDEIISGRKQAVMNDDEFKLLVLNDEKKELVGKKVEHAIVYDADGQRMFKTSTGEKHQVVFTDAQVLAMKNSRVLTHNHPSGGSLSPPDLRIASTHNIQEIRAVGSKYWYSARRIDSWPSPEKIKAAMDEADMEVRRELTKKLENNEITYEWANLNHQHLVLEKVAKRTGFMYERVEW